MKREKFLKITTTALLSLPVLSCKDDFEYFSNEEEITINSAKKWYNNNNITRNSRINADGIERDIVWKYANEIKSNQTKPNLSCCACKLQKQ